MNANDALDKWEELLEKAYNNRPQNESYEDFLDSLPTVERHAVLLGTMDGQVKNGGWKQWVGNGYATQLQMVLRVLKQMGTDSAQKVVGMLRKLAPYIDSEMENRGTFHRYWKNGDGPDEDFLSALDDEYYALDEAFEKEVIAYLESFSPSEK